MHVHLKQNQLQNITLDVTITMKYLDETFIYGTKLTTKKCKNISETGYLNAQTRVDIEMVHLCPKIWKLSYWEVKCPYISLRHDCSRPVSILLAVSDGKSNEDK